MSGCGRAMSRSVDAVVIGSGHNGLVAAAYLARAGWSVEVLERNDAAGGAIATEELTAPGYRHDTFSSWHPLYHASAAWAELGAELRARGLDYANAEDVVTATVRDDGSAVVAHRDPGRTAAGLSPADAEAYAEDLDALGGQMDLVGELLGTELHSANALRLTGRLGRRLGLRDGLAFAARVTSSARGWLLGRFDGPEVPDLLAPWVLHTGLTPEDSGGGFQLQALAGARDAGGPGRLERPRRRLRASDRGPRRDRPHRRRGGADHDGGRAGEGRRRGRRGDRRAARGDREHAPDPALRPAAARRPDRARARRARGRALPLRRPGGHADPPYALRAAALACGPAARRGRDRPRDR